MIERGTRVRLLVQFDGRPIGALGTIRHSYDERGLYYDVEINHGDWSGLYTLKGSDLEVVAAQDPEDERVAMALREFEL